MTTYLKCYTWIIHVVLVFWPNTVSSSILRLYSLLSTVFACFLGFFFSTVWSESQVAVLENSSSSLREMRIQLDHTHTLTLTLSPLHFWSSASVYKPTVQVSEDCLMSKCGPVQLVQEGPTNTTLTHNSEKGKVFSHVVCLDHFSSPSVQPCTFSVGDDEPEIPSFLSIKTKIFNIFKLMLEENKLGNDTMGSWNQKKESVQWRTEPLSCGWHYHHSIYFHLI